ncbi:MAG: hypothetical protein ACTSVF_03335 [Candidatus Asgardarchaeia archaeon]
MIPLQVSKAWVKVEGLKFGMFDVERRFHTLDHEFAEDKLTIVRNPKLISTVAELDEDTNFHLILTTNMIGCMRQSFQERRTLQTLVVFECKFQAQTIFPIVIVVT